VEFTETISRPFRFVDRDSLIFLIIRPVIAMVGGRAILSINWVARQHQRIYHHENKEYYTDAQIG
jgi:hypothetical protein